MNPTAEKTLTAIVTVLLAIIGVAVLALLVSKNAQTGQVISTGSGGFACMLLTAMTGNPNNQYCSALAVPSVSSSINFGGIVPPGGGGL